MKKRDPSLGRRQLPFSSGPVPGIVLGKDKTMKIIRILILSSVLSAVGAMEVKAALILQCQPAGAHLRLILNSQTGTNYQFQVSTNLTTWEDLGMVITGDGLSKTQTVATVDQPMAFFRVRTGQDNAGPAPSDAEFTALVIGKTLFTYTFVDATRFNWFGEPGNWDYAEISSNRGTLIFTYDEDGNHPAIYREEIVLTYQTATQGTYRYSEFNFDFEDSGSIRTGFFNLTAP
jgi:hypothetical protein